MTKQPILIVGTGHVGLCAALRLSKKLDMSEAEVTIVDSQPHMTYQPFLPESAAGNISPRHAVVPIAAAGTSRVRPWITGRSRPARSCS